ncbi:MAG: Asr1405/Asl0597 family protein [Microcoleaceae cyanobacterium]
MFTNNNSQSQDFITVVSVSRIDRWLIHNRLQELMINSWCPTNGELLVEVNHGIDAILVRSTVKQLVAPRAELVDWLERCWQMQVFPKNNR